MTIEDIQRLIEKDETRTLELKKTTGELKDGMHSACAFLNTDGGWLMFGIAPTSLKILGQQVTDNTRQEIARAIAGLEPMVDIAVDYIDMPDKPGFQIIAMHFRGWKWGEEPFTYHGCPYIRIESTTQVMSREMYDERLKAARPDEYAWERQCSNGLSLADLDEVKVRGAVRLGVEANRINASALLEPMEVILEKWKLLKNGQPNNGAAALFASHSGSFTQFGIRMARFHGTDKNEFIDNQRAEGNFFDLLDAGMEFLLKHLSISGKIVGLHREDQMEIPTEALREALINCLCHRAMEQFRAIPSIAVYDDRVEISNPGKFIAGITPENIKQPHGSFPYNPLIANVLFKSTFLESWGSGVKRILELCRTHNVPEPFYTISPGYVTITFPRPAASVNDGKNVGNNVGNPTESQLTERQALILNLLEQDGYLSMHRMSEILSVNEKTVERDYAKLKAGGYIRKEGKTKGVFWTVLKH